jgi:hypothetical protein
MSVTNTLAYCGVASIGWKKSFIKLVPTIDQAVTGFKVSVISHWWQCYKTFFFVTDAFD